MLTFSLLLAKERLLYCTDEVAKANKERRENGNTIRRLVTEADAAFIIKDENADELMETEVQRVFANDMSTPLEFKLKRADAIQVLKDWKAAKEVYFGILRSMTGPDDGSARSNGKSLWVFHVVHMSSASTRSVRRVQRLDWSSIVTNIDAAIETMNWLFSPPRNAVG
jgi:hypothetical protein